MDVLYKTQADLLKGKEKLEQMMQNLEKEKVRDYAGLLDDSLIHFLLKISNTPSVFKYNVGIQGWDSQNTCQKNKQGKPWDCAVYSSHNVLDPFHIH